MKHTKEPWYAIQNKKWRNANYRISNKENDEWGSFGQIAYASEYNAKRIVACVNACAGMENPLEEIAELKRQLTWRPVSEKPEKDEMCTWQEDEDGLWHTDCHEIHQFFDGTPTENSYKFCPYCAKPLKEEKYNDQKE